MKARALKKLLEAAIEILEDDDDDPAEALVVAGPVLVEDSLIERFTALTHGEQESLLALVAGMRTAENKRKA